MNKKCTNISMVIMLTLLLIFSACTDSSIALQPDEPKTVAPAVSNEAGNNDSASNITHADDTQNESLNEAEKIKSPSWALLLNRVLEEERLNEYAKVVVNYLDDNTALLGVNPEHCPDPVIKHVPYWYLLKIDEDRYQKVEGEYSQLLKYENNIATAYCDGQFFETNHFLFPFLYHCNTQTGETYQTLYFANLSYQLKFVIGGVNMDYTLIDIQKNESVYDLHLQSTSHFDGPPRGIISSTCDTVKLQLEECDITEGISELDKVVLHQDVITETATILLNSEGAKKYTCEMEQVNSQYWIYKIKFSSE